MTEDRKLEGTKTANPKESLIWGLPRNVASFVVIAVTSAIVYRVVTVQCSIVFDFPTLLSLLLALFSVALSALFYFKATDTSNAFYDNTYKFTQQIAELLVKIESGFGERLRHLDEAYHGMRDSFDKLPARMVAKAAKEELAEEKQSESKLIEERDRIIKELASKSQLNATEREKVLSQLSEKDKALMSARSEIALLTQRLHEAQMQRKQSISEAELDPELIHIISRLILPEIGGKQAMLVSPSGLARRFERVLPTLPRSVVARMQHLGLLSESGSLSPDGAILIRNVARRYRRIENTDDSNNASEGTR